MWRVLGWTLVVGLSCAEVAAAGQESTIPRQLEARRVDEAVALLSRAFTVSEERLRKEALTLSEEQLMSLLRSLRADEERIYSLAKAHPDDARVLRLAMTVELLRKGRSLAEATRTVHAIHHGLGPESREDLERLRDLRDEFATLALQGPGSLAGADYPQRLDTLASRKAALEAELARRSAPQRAGTALPSPEEIVDCVAASLPADGALLELITYADRPWGSKPGTAASQGSSPTRYLALVLFPDARIRAIDLGPAEAIDSAASALGDAFASRAVDYQARAQTLYAQVFRPVRSLLGGTRRLYLAPDGPLGLVPFHALHDGHRFLIEDFEITHLTSGNELLSRTEVRPSSGSVLILADPDFDGPTPPHGFSEAMESALAWRMTLSPPSRGALGERYRARLPGTRHEARAIQRLYPQARLFLGADATKDRLLGVSAPGILHVATHGFFDEDTRATPGSRALGVGGSFSGASSALRPQDPMLSSGLLLASEEAQASELRGGTLRPRGTRVTALELAGMDLWGTELVVLSACDTGLGVVEPGQGIHGLRRAFVIAGAETVVTSLWQVDDDTTRVLMESYYLHLRAGAGRSAALRDAMLALRKIHAHPYYWAPFISLGRDTPLRTRGAAR
jgi:CHAT domain-containing protein